MKITCGRIALLLLEIDPITTCEMLFKNVIRLSKIFKNIIYSFQVKNIIEFTKKFKKISFNFLKSTKNATIIMIIFIIFKILWHL